MLTPADNGKTITVQPGSRIVVDLPENPTTGYSWTVDDLDPEVPLVSSEYAGGKSVQMGGGGTRTLVFEAKGSGSHKIRLNRWRHWEGDASVRERYQVGVNIQPR
jgi:inhibitor of cysteine peptidase